MGALANRPADQFCSPEEERKESAFYFLDMLNSICLLNNQGKIGRVNLQIRSICRFSTDGKRCAKLNEKWTRSRKRTTRAGPQMPSEERLSKRAQSTEASAAERASEPVLASN